MRTRSQLNRSLTDNLIWLLGSLVLALLVWVIASFQSDPIVEQRFPERVAVQMTPDAGLLLTSPPQATARPVWSCARLGRCWIC